MSNRMPSPYNATIDTVRRELTQTFAAVDLWFDRPGTLRAYRPNDGGWTIDEILEHITLTSHFLLIIIRKGCNKALRRAQTRPPLSGESDFGRLLTLSGNQSLRWERPDHMEPSGRRTSDEIRRLMDGQLQECLGLLDLMRNGEGSLCTVRMSVNDLGKMDMYQWLLFLAQHARRHLRQMQENETEYRQSNKQTYD